MPAIHFVLLNYSRHVTQLGMEQGLLARTDRRFVEGARRFARDLLHVDMVLTVDQFFSMGFAERKAIFVCDLVREVRRVHNEHAKAAGKPTTTTRDAMRDTTAHSLRVETGSCGPSLAVDAEAVPHARPPLPSSPMVATPASPPARCPDCRRLAARVDDLEATVARLEARLRAAEEAL